MKLNKVLALALSGVMAVSMLAGCAPKADDGKDDSDVVVVPTTAAGKVIAALDSDVTDKVTFATDSNLQTILENVAENTGWNTVSSTGVDVTDLIAVDRDLGNTVKLIKVNQHESDDKTAATFIAVKTLTAAKNVNEAYAVEQLSNWIEDLQVYDDTNGTCADLPAYTIDYTDHYYTFKYAGSVAVTSVKNAVTGETVYTAAVTVTRTPTEIKK